MGKSLKDTLIVNRVLLKKSRKHYNSKTIAESSFSAKSLIFCLNIEDVSFFRI